MTDIARMGPGIEGYHILGELERACITHGDELWMYLTTDLIYWDKWDSEPILHRDEFVAIKLNDTWYLISEYLVSRSEGNRI
jgi:hypothetical protein